MMRKFLLPLLSGALLTQLVGCSDTPIPKPRGFQRLQLPEHEYILAQSACGFKFEIPTYAILLPDTHPLAEKCWYNILYTPFNATLHLSYKTFDTREELISMSEDARNMVYKHTVKADEIYESVIKNRHLRGMLYELLGSTATNFQFYITDTAGKFILGSLYFNTQTNNDSVAPAFEHLRKDVLHAIETLRWD
jgi:gliding motility-associated lipoprotein GldD